ncbi:putative thimet oligopeptidase [Vitis vinifera]|uniref:Putative thimet oligopeptidase n=1 Tax=Vitis vinifera TaxID=29760 RepID=A0A438DIV9_VITVI|nr:putative thimet oligopeptidase [Vitis vinifera]
MVREKKDRRYNLLALTGSAALLALAINLAISAVNAHTKKRKRRDLAGSNVRVNLSAPEILQLANSIISKSKAVHDAVGSVPLDKATYANVVLPLAELEAQQFPLVQSCIFPKLVSTSEEVRKASAEAEQRIDSHVLMCRGAWSWVQFLCWLKALNYSMLVVTDMVSNPRNAMNCGMFMAKLERKNLTAEGMFDVVKCSFHAKISQREDVYCVVKAFVARGEWISPEANRYVQCLIRDFERNGLNLTSTKREEVQRLRAHIDDLSVLYIKNMSDESTFLLFSETELAGLPPEFLQSLDKAENGKFKVYLRSRHVIPVLELCKVWSSLPKFSVSHGAFAGKSGISILLSWYDMLIVDFTIQSMKIGMTRKTVAVAYGKRGGEANPSVLKSLVMQIEKPYLFLSAL